MELVSLHLPKAAGTSFRKTLEDNYGDKLIFDYFNSDVSKLDLSGVSCVHGHLNVSKYYNVNPNVKIITWLRNPLNRIISYYNYWKSRPVNDGNDWHIKFKKESPSFMDFVRNFTFLRNELNIYLGGVNIDDLYFIGIVERYEQDVNVLSNMLNWAITTTYNTNKTAHKEEIIMSQSDIKEFNRIMDFEISLKKVKERGM
jgi:hypothetical protein